MKYFRVRYKIGKERRLEVIEALNRIEAIKSFAAMSLGVMQSAEETAQPLSMRIKKFKAELENPIKNRRVKDEGYVALLEEMYVMLDAGMPINTSLAEAIDGTEDTLLKAIFAEILDDIEGGLSLTQAAGKYTLQLGTLSISMFEVGEKTGTLSESIRRLADITEEIHENRMKFKKATRYPLFTMLVMAVAFTVVITFVVPQFEELFASSKLELPFPTKFLLWLEHAITTYGPYILGGAIVIAGLFARLYEKSDKVHLQADKLLLRIYIVGEVTYYAMVGRFVYIFDVLTQAGIPIVEALHAANGVVENRYLSEQLEKIALAIEEGKSLHHGFQETGLIENVPLQMLKAGEQSGSIGAMLKKVDKLYKRKYNYIIDNVATMIEPILIAAIAGFVLLLALGIFLPMWKMV
ncbi:MAG: type II secretion system F family protein, partial [Thiovulaceae bacterium]|nr:type II secretion system F family protein [Sulfurimonadaceae bacterium]